MCLELLLLFVANGVYTQKGKQMYHPHSLNIVDTQTKKIHPFSTVLYLLIQLPPLIIKQWRFPVTCIGKPKLHMWLWKIDTYKHIGAHMHTLTHIYSQYTQTPQCTLLIFQTCYNINTFGSIMIIMSALSYFNARV